MKADGATEIIHKLVTEQGYDIIVEQMRPDVMARLGVGYEALTVICPNIIYCSLTGYGQTGPLRDRAGHDLKIVLTVARKLYGSPKILTCGLR